MTDYRIENKPEGTYRIEGQSAGIRLSPLFEALLNSARHLIGLGLGSTASAAVIIAQTAIEVCTERVISRFLALRGAAFLQDWIDHRRLNYNVWSREDVKALYKAVTQDETITDQPFWTSGRLKTHVELRNRVAHKGRMVTPEEATASVVVAEEIIEHMVRIATAASVDLDDSR